MIDIFGLKFHGYGLMIALAVIVAWEIAKRYGRVKPETIEGVAFGVIVSGVVGARLYHVVDYWDFYSKNIIKVFELWNGGLGIWGAIIGGLAYAFYYARKNKINFLILTDSIVLGLPLAQAIGRVGNFINGELYGKNGEPLFAWEGILNVILFSVLFLINKKNKESGVVTGTYMIGYGLIRILLENYRESEIIWRAGGVPVAIWFGLISIIFGLKLIYGRK